MISQKTILVPTNFRVSSLHPLRLALELIEEPTVDVVLLYCQTLDDSITELLFYSSTQIIRDLSTHNFKDAISILRNRFDHKIEDLRIELFHGYAQSAFDTLLDTLGIDSIFLSQSYPLHLGKRGFDPGLTLKSVRFSTTKWARIGIPTFPKKINSKIYSCINPYEQDLVSNNTSQPVEAVFTFFDSRWEDLTKDNWAKVAYRDFSAGLIVAMTAIPMAMGFAMAMGMRPENGIIAGALACAVGRTFGGSKYQVYGPTAAFIPVIAALITKYGPAGGGDFATAHSFLVFVSILAGIILIIMGIYGFGRYAKLVPNSIIVGFTVGIAVAIALTNLEDILGIESFSSLLGQDEDVKGGLIDNLRTAYQNLDKINGWSILLGVLTFVVTKAVLRISIFIPGPLIAMVLATVLSATVLADKDIVLVKDIYGSIPNNFFVFTAPALPALSGSVLFDVIYFVSAIVFVSGVESVLCSSMADRLANNQKTPFNPDKEFFGQGMVQIITPLVQGFPCTGALARTATSIKAGAVTPMAGYFKAILKLTLAYYLAQYLELIPMACIGGILVWVASNMIKPSEIREVRHAGKFELAMMVYTAVMVPLTDFLTGVLSALIIYFVAKRFIIGKKKEVKVVDNISQE